MGHNEFLTATANFDYSQVDYSSNNIYEMLSYVWNLSEQRCALYLRGSFSNWKGFNPLDIDVYYVLYEDDLSISDIDDRVKLKFPNLPNLDISMFTKKNLLNTDKRLMTKLILLNEGKFIFGENLIPLIEQIPLNEECAISISFKQTIIVSKKLFAVCNIYLNSKNIGTNAYDYSSSSIAKSVLRLVMHNFIRYEGVFNRNVLDCHDYIIANHPELTLHAKMMLDRINGMHFSLGHFLNSAIILYHKLHQPEYE
ncbi:MAG: hypothetical protein QM535_19065 [Limnohabitans sp.]|nr:hypothetical protein [Limnohabitans sp.]